MSRSLDIMLSLLILILSGPVLVIIFFLVRIKLGVPVIFRQIRPGKDCKPFEMVKFRTMTDSADNNGILLPDAQRLTPFSQFLRRSSLDELPEFWNVLKGDMSLVGPRPLLFEYVELYNDEQRRRNSVKPGITGWAQVNGRNSITWEEKFKLDVWYVDNRSLWLDIKIIYLTIIKTFLQDGICAQGEATMSRFVGSQKVDKK